jgi:regulator of protease activity HflC (stomatin/prohibitin superfamily)
MKGLIAMLGRIVGIYFTPDNHATPVLRLGRYHRVEQPGFCWKIPILEQALPPVKTSLHVGNFTFFDVPSKDNIHFKVQMTVLFTFKPTEALKSAAAMLVRGGDDLLQVIVKDYTNQGLRRLASRFEAEEFCWGSAMSTIEQNLTHFLTAEMHTLGIAPLRRGGILIKETIAPDKFKQTMLNVRLHEATLRVLASYRELNLIKQAIQAEFVTGLEDLEGNLTLLSTFSPLETVYPAYPLDPHQLSTRNGQTVRNGH